MDVWVNPDSMAEASSKGSYGATFNFIMKRLFSQRRLAKGSLKDNTAKGFVALNKRKVKAAKGVCS